MTLDEVKPGQSAVIKKSVAQGVLAQRLMDLGFFRGAEVQVLRNAPLVDPVEFVLDGHHVSLRHEEARLLEVASVEG